jgi:hypothetical protein
MLASSRLVLSSMRCAFCRSISSELGNSPGRAFTVNTRSAEDCPAVDKMFQWFQKSSAACQNYHKLPAVKIIDICTVVVFPLHINNLISSLARSCYVSRGNTCQVLNLGSIIYPTGEWWVHNSNENVLLDTASLHDIYWLSRLCVFFSLTELTEAHIHL